MQARDLSSHLDRFKNDIHKCVNLIQEPEALKADILTIFRTHVQEDDFVSVLYYNASHLPNIKCAHVCMQNTALTY